MHRPLIVFTLALIAAAAFAPAQAKSVPCIGGKCPGVTFTAQGCTFANTGKDDVAITIFPDDAWKKANPGTKVPVEFTLKPGEKHATQACLSPEANIEYWTAFGAQPTTSAHKTTSPGSFFATEKVAPCTGEACKEIELREFDDCLWLQSKSEKPIATKLTLESGTTLTLALEGADAAKAKREESAASGPARQMTAARAAECDKALKSAALLENARREGTNVEASDIDATAAACRAEQAAADAARKSAATAPPVIGYHYSIYYALSGTEYPVFRAKVMNKDTCVAKTALKSYVADFE
jgi:hypothetical protein